MRTLLIVALSATLFGVTAATGIAAEYEAVKLDEAPPKGELSAAMAESLQQQGIAVKRGGRTVCEIWLRKSWPIQAGFQPTFELLYPFKEGELIGVIRFPRRAHDFRDQEIASGTYTLRYALQPVDGNHVGTSPTRDFLALLPSGQDTSIEPIASPDTIIEQSTEVSQTSHPALLAMQPTQQPAGELPSMRHDQTNDWWIVQFSGTGQADGKTEEVQVDVVVLGAAIE